MSSLSQPTDKNLLRIGVVGPCGSGKTTLINLLKTKRPELELHHIAQEHSYVADMWKRLVNPDILIFLEVGFAYATNRRQLSWNNADYQEQQRRLKNARENASLVIETDELSPIQVAEIANNYIDRFINNFIK
jgi:ATPase subunit of ABC transporter with duplicated ATPase domains